jgi:hypothetical protein
MMIKETFSVERQLMIRHIAGDLVIVGGGLSGVCCAITAARMGARVILVQDRPVLGGNASSEVRLWILGATSHMGNNNRWAREGGLVDEILVENMYRNPEGNPVIFDTILLDKVVSEKGITLLLNTVVYEVTKKDDHTIGSLKAVCSQNQVTYELTAPLFCDSSGDGIVAFLSGAAFRMGAEPREEFNERFAPDKSYGELLGHSLYFYSKDTGKPVSFKAPSFALKDIRKIPRFRSFNAREFGCKLWWIEYGGRLDTVHETETIKWELWKVVYGVWDYIKNSGNYPEAETMTLEWVGSIPGKRESRRFEGDHILTQDDIVTQRLHADAVSHGGWAIDLHPADGVYAGEPGCSQWHSKGIYQIPYRCLYARDIRNLFLAGRIISASHVAFGSSRVMATSAAAAQAVAHAAVLCKTHGLFPADIYRQGLVRSLQQELLKTGQFIPHITLSDEADLVRQAVITATSRLAMTGIPAGAEWMPLAEPAAQLLPAGAGPIPVITVETDADEDAELSVELRVSSRPAGYTPDKTLQWLTCPIKKGKDKISFRFDCPLEEPQYIFIVFQKDQRVKLRCSFQRVTGILSVFNTTNPAVSNFGKQSPPDGIGMDSFEFWCPKRRPAGYNIALQFETPIHIFDVAHLRNGVTRPTTQPNAWVADPLDPNPRVTLSWPQRRRIGRVELSFDTDFDHPMESVLMGHPEKVMPFCVRNYHITDETGKTVFSCKGNYQTRNSILFEEPVLSNVLHFHLEHPSEDVPAAIFEIRCYGTT